MRREAARPRGGMSGVRHPPGACHSSGRPRGGTASRHRRANRQADSRSARSRVRRGWHPLPTLRRDAHARRHGLRGVRRGHSPYVPRQPIPHARVRAGGSHRCERGARHRLRTHPEARRSTRARREGEAQPGIGQHARDHMRDDGPCRRPDHMGHIILQPQG